jgi:hypothetical protein
MFMNESNRCWQFLFKEVFKNFLLQPRIHAHIQPVLNRQTRE